MSRALITFRDRKGRHAVNLFEAAYNKAKLDETCAQKLNERGEELQNGILQLIQKLTLPDQYVDEEVESNYGYLSGYSKPVPIKNQIDILRSHWPQLNPDRAIRYARKVYSTFQFPDWVEGPFVLVRPGFFSDVYGEELEEVLKALSKSLDGRFFNYCEGKLGPDQLRCNEQTLTSFNQIVRQQENSDILVVAEQFGIRHRGKSIRRARVVFIANEFGEGAKSVGTMLITHPNRLAHYNDLWINCAGDEYAPEADGDFSNAPYFNFNDGQVRFYADWSDNVFEDVGSVSAFLPQVDS